MKECREILEKIVMMSELQKLRDLAAQAVHKVFAVNVDNLVRGNGNPDIQEECQEIREMLEKFGCNAPADDMVLYDEVIRPLHFMEVRSAR